jgi:hypothetical protein
MTTFGKQLEGIQSREDLVRFIHALRQDFLDNPDTWENDTLQRCLDALAAWINDMDGYFQNRDEPIPSQPSWQLIGQMLIAASMYE